tara:strand:+ start:467 stop:622 length:156 start_codon:yes stop_codon:yes gene_type:complete
MHALIKDLEMDGLLMKILSHVHNMATLLKIHVVVLKCHETQLKDNILTVKR